MLIAALLTIAKQCKQHRCSTSNERMKKLWYIYTKEYYSYIKNTIMLFADKGTEVDIIMLSKVIQVLMGKVHMFSLVCRS
jgi:hypothetical protein